LVDQTSGTAGADFGADARQFAALQRALPFEEGWGYRAGISHHSGSRPV
jgi:hypothetical protein